MNGILFAGCSFTWGQGLYYYSDLKRIPTMKEWNYDYSLMTDALINFKNTVRYPRLVANHFKTFEFCRDTNGGSDELSTQFIKTAFDMDDKINGSFDYLTKQEFKYEDISYVIFQTTQPYRSSFKFVYKDETYYMWPNDLRTKMVRICKLEDSGLYTEMDNSIDIFSGYLNETKINNVMSVVADYYRISTSDLISKKRTSNYVFPRQIAMYLIKTMYDLPYKKIGSYFSNRDHSTVMHSVEKITNEMTMVKDVKKDVEKLKLKCGEN
jgi:hypothetical protein